MKINNNQQTLFSSTNNQSSIHKDESSDWGKIFDQAQQSITTSNSNLNRYDNSTSSNKVTSLNINLNPTVIEYERYKSFNDLEKKFQEQKLYDVNKITNKYHHTQTNNHFKLDIQKDFKATYGDWDGTSEDGKGFAYVDKYGFSHVLDNFFDALIYSKDGKVYNYEGKLKGGYALDSNGDRMWLAGLDGSKPFGNSQYATEADKKYVEDNVFKNSTTTSSNQSATAQATKENSTHTDRYLYTSSARDSVNTKEYKLFEIFLNYSNFVQNNNFTQSEFYQSKLNSYL